MGVYFLRYMETKNNIPLCGANVIVQPCEEKNAFIVKKHKFFFYFYKKQQKLSDNSA